MEKSIFHELCERELLDKLYGFVYLRAADKRDVEDICHNIVLELLVAEKKGRDMSYSYIWQVARNMISDFYGRGKKQERRICELTDANVNVMALSAPSFEDEIIREAEESERLAFILREISYMGEIYRRVMVRFYIDGRSIAEIAREQNIPENRVKQRLFSAKEKLRKETDKMTSNTSYNKPITLATMGNGIPSKSDLRDKLRSALAQNICYACRKSAKSAAELASELSVPAYYIEDMAEAILGEPLMKTPAGKYIANFIIIDLDEENEINKHCEKVAADVASQLKDYFEANREAFENLPQLGLRQSYNDILWSYIATCDMNIVNRLGDFVKAKLDSLGVKPEVRDFYVLGEATAEGEAKEFRGYSWNGQRNDKYYIGCITGERLPYSLGNRFFYADTMPAHIDIIFRCIGGLDAKTLGEDEKASLAEACRLNYVKEVDGKFYPDILIYERREDFEDSIFAGTSAIFEGAAEKLASSYIDFIKKHVPEHLLGQAKNTVTCSIHLRHFIIEEALRLGIIDEAKEGDTTGIFAYTYPER